MKNEKNQQQIYCCLSNLLNYPTPNLVEQTHHCVELLNVDYPQMADPMAHFVSFVENTPLGRLEEIYTGTFDINPACHIFAGHILFGESFQRGAFMAKLIEEYQQHDFDTSKELADHIPLLLRFLGQLEPNNAFAMELMSDCLIPVFQKMNANFKDNSENPYVPVLRATSVVLERAIMPNT